MSDSNFHTNTNVPDAQSLVNQFNKVMQQQYATKTSNLFNQEYEETFDDPDPIFIVTKDDQETGAIVVAAFTEREQAEKYIEKYDVFTDVQWFIDEIYVDSEVEYEDVETEDNIGYDGGVVHADRTGISVSPSYANIPTSNSSMPGGNNLGPVKYVSSTGMYQNSN